MPTKLHRLAAYPSGDASMLSGLTHSIDLDGTGGQRTLPTDAQVSTRSARSKWIRKIWIRGPVVGKLWVGGVVENNHRYTNEPVSAGIETVFATPMEDGHGLSTLSWHQLRSDASYDGL